VLGVTEAVQRGNPDTHLAGLVALCCGLLPANLGLRLASGLQRQWVVGTSQAIVSLLTLLLTVLCVGLEVAPRWFLAGSLALPILINGGLLAILWRRLPAESPDADRPAIRHWLREGLPFFVPQLSASLRANGPSFIIASVLGAAAVTPYNLIQRVLNFVTQPQNWLLDPLWSGITDAASRADYTWIRSVLRLLLVLSTVCTVLPLLSMLGWGPWFVQWWTGFAASNLPGGLLAWLVAAQVGIVLIQPFTICLNGLGWMRGQMIYGTITSVLSLGAMAVLCPRWGLATALAPTAILLLGFNLPCAWWDVRQVMRRWTPEGKNA
jgi:O-antigen/teichoic acid export membrane protein